MKINFWAGHGRRLIVLPGDIIKHNVKSNGLINNLYIKGVGYYPNAENHFTVRPKGFENNLLIFCTNGKGTCNINSSKHNVNTNQFFIIPAGVPHSYESDKSMPWSIYWVYFGGSALAKLNGLPSMKKCQSPTLARNTREIENGFMSMLDILERGFATEHLLKANMELQKLLSITLFDHLLIEEDRSVDNHTKLVNIAISLMQEKINGYLNNEMIAEKLGYSHVHFYRIFKERTGFSPIDYYINLKIQEACRLLVFSNLKVKDVAAQLMYDDVYYFSRIFKKKTGFSPLEYQVTMMNRKP
jgi:AraC family transcriptional regulator, arabinose operon regulatory protein